MIMSQSESGNKQPIVIAVNGNQTCYIPLEDSVERTQQANKALKDRNFKLMTELRGSSFQRNLETYIKMSKLEPKQLSKEKKKNYRFAVLNLGAPASGVNSAIRSFVRHAISNGCTCLAVQDGFEGFAAGLMKKIEWKDV
jgi:6-phosphofructokinase 1